MAISASAIVPSNSLEEFRIEFNNLVTDVSGIASGTGFGASIIFEGATADEYETTLTVVDPTADRTVTIPNETGTLVTTNTTSSTTVVGIVELATDAETVTGTDTDRAVTPAGLHAGLAGLAARAITASDTVIFADATDSHALKEDTVQGILDLAGDLLASNNLSDVSNASTSLSNLGGAGLGIVLALG